MWDPFVSEPAFYFLALFLPSPSLHASAISFSYIIRLCSSPMARWWAEHPLMFRWGKVEQRAGGSSSSHPAWRASVRRGVHGTGGEAPKQRWQRRWGAVRYSCNGAQGCRGWNSGLGLGWVGSKWNLWFVCTLRIRLGFFLRKINLCHKYRLAAITKVNEQDPLKPIHIGNKEI